MRKNNLLLTVRDFTPRDQDRIARLLKNYFPELGTDNEMNCADVVQELCYLYSSLPQVEVQS